MWSRDSEQCQSRPKLTEWPVLVCCCSFTIHAGEMKLKLQSATSAADSSSQKQPTQLNMVPVPPVASFLSRSSSTCIWNARARRGNQHTLVCQYYSWVVCAETPRQSGGKTRMSQARATNFCVGGGKSQHMRFYYSSGNGTRCQSQLVHMAENTKTSWDRAERRPVCQTGVWTVVNGYGSSSR